MRNGRGDLSTAFEKYGYFWLDDDTCTMVAGTLRYHPETGSALDLLGRLQPLEIPGGTIEIIRGVSSENEKLTLLSCFHQGTTYQQNSFEIQKFYCDVTLIGNFHPQSTLAFQKAGIRFHQLDHWLKSDYIKTSFGSEDDIGREFGVTVRSGRQGTLECDQGGYKMHLDAQYSFKTDRHNVDLNTFITLYIETDFCKNLQWFLEEAKSLRDFVGLCFASPLPLRSVKLFGAQIPVADGITQTEVVAAFFIERVPAIPSQAPYPLIGFRRFEVSVPNVLSVWREKREQFQEVIDLVFLVLYGHYTRPEVGFLVIMQAFEAFDRKVNPGTLVSPEKFKEVRDAMVAAIPQEADADLRQKMKDAIRYANEPSLRKRLKSFRDRLVLWVGSEAYGFQSSRINPLVQTRNYYTHYPESLKDEILCMPSMVDETDRFSMLLIICLLHEIGVPHDQTRNGLGLHGRFRRFTPCAASSTGSEVPT